MDRDLASLAAEIAPAFVREPEASTAPPIDPEGRVDAVEQEPGVTLPPSDRASPPDHDDSISAPTPGLDLMTGCPVVVDPPEDDAGAAILIEFVRGSLH